MHQRSLLHRVRLPFPTSAIPAPFLVPSLPVLYLLSPYIAGKIQSTAALDRLLLPWFARAGITKENVPLATLGVVWILTYYISSIGSTLGQVMAKKEEGFDNQHPRIHRRDLTDRSARLLAAHENLMEQFPGFASAVIVAHVTKVPLDKQIGFGILYMVARFLYYPAYIFNADLVRTSTFYIALGCLPWLFGLSVASRKVSILGTSRLAWLSRSHTSV